MTRFYAWFALVLALAVAPPARAETLRMAVTTSFHNSGLSDVLLPRAQADLGLDVELLVVGTGQALRLGRAGDVDAILVHSRAAEIAFVEEGFGTHRREIMYNDFVIVGPERDPATIGGAESATEALAAIAGAAAPFVSRGDESGTHRRELALWEAAGIVPEGAWYRAVGAGMGAALNVASAMDAYILSDRASWLNFGNKGGLDLLFAGDPALFNQYAFLPVDPKRHRHVAFDAALRFEEWLASQPIQTLIGAYEIDGESLFVPNAGPRPGG
ncbi:MAG: substrate-binding domain-containing protein [Paracoccaceae bacterium]|nr:substrate-binding domain-containing protein [Paracoccaceae bacterium]